MMGKGAGEWTPSATLAERLDRLFRTVRKPDGSEYSLREVADAITATGESISFAYIGQLRNGVKDNPNIRHLHAIAKFFGVPLDYFTNERLAETVAQELDLL